MEFKSSTLNDGENLELCRVNQREFEVFAGCEMEGAWQMILKTEMSIYMSKANFDVQTLFGKTTHL